MFSLKEKDILQEIHTTFVKFFGIESYNNYLSKLQ
ncbi:MAG: hypothetical protein Ta2D_10550 [Rickettsiales bacterium]|nr:MAG: hypothetical protein Ta2D_10550 [Rickettsiales bacterium]